MERIKPANITNIITQQCPNKYLSQKLYKNRNVYAIPFSNKPLDLNNEERNKLCIQNNFLKQVCNNIDENDSDFELMFSNKYAPFVGSYEYHIGASLAENYYSNEDQNSF